MQPNEPRLIIIKVQYERWPACGWSLRWIAPELKDAALTLVEDEMDDETPSRTWTGIVDGPTFERFAKAWHLLDGTDARDPAGFYVFDGLNWETDGESPIVCVTLNVFGHQSAGADVGRPSAET
jgi:hypothetical protein